MSPPQQQKKPGQSLPQQQKKPGPQSGWVTCANIAKVFNLIVPVLMSIILTITIIVLAVQKNTKNIKFLATLLGIFIFVILVVIWLSNHFRSREY